MITVRTSPAYVNRVRQDWTANGGVYGDGGVYAVVPSNDPFAQLGPTLDLTFAGVPTDQLTAATVDGYSINLNLSSEIYQIAAQYTVWTATGLTQVNFADIVTFTRTGSTATYFNSAGVLTTAAADQPRFDYNPSTLAAQGLLIEEARTNLLTYSADFSDASWTKTDVTITADNTTDPAGTTTADLLTEGTAGTAFTTRAASATVAAGATVSSSVFVKRSAVIQWLRVRVSNSAASNGGNVWFDIQNGVLGNQTNVGSGTGTVGTITAINNGWYRITATTTLTAGDTTASTGFCSASANGSTTRVNSSAYWLWGAQLEAGAFPTSYIPTTTMALTRNRDEASVNTLSPWFNATEGTLFAEYVASNSAQNNAATAFSDGTNNNRMIIRATNASAQTAFIGVSSGSTQWAGVIATALLNTITKSAFGYKVDDIAWVRNGGTVGTDTTAIIPTVTGLKLGADGDGTLLLNGHLRRITYYPRRLSNADLQTITT